MRFWVVETVDTATHWLLDGYIDRKLPGWGVLQHIQWKICNAFEYELERV